uniref:DUF4705 domain-containing protein n=1 Tax=Theropithecus gelada TaxID=9565 RepID=A0A8D2E1A3_THEGE
MQPPQSEVPAFWQLRQAPLLPPDVGLSRSGCSIPASSPGPALPPGCVYRPNSCLTATSLDSAPAHLLAAFVGPKLPQAKLSRTSSGLTVASPGGSAPALRQSLQVPKLPPADSSRPSLGLLAATACLHIVLKSASQGPAPASRRPLQAQVILNSVSPGPALSSWPSLQVHNVLPSASPDPAPPASRWPSLCLTANFPTPRPQPHCSLPSLKLQPSSSFDRPLSCFLMASSDPANSSQWPFWAQFVPFWRPPQAEELLKLESPDPAAASRHPLQAQLFLSAACTGPTPASQQPLWTQFPPNSWWHL